MYAGGSPAAVGASLHDSPSPGAPVPPMSLPLVDTTKVVGSLTLPSARATSGSEARSRTIAPGRVADDGALSKSPLTVSGRTTTSPTVSTMPLNTLPRVSVKMSDPDTNETPRMIAKALMNSRSLRPIKLFQLARNMSGAALSGEVRHPLEDLLGRGLA